MKVAKDKKGKVLIVSYLFPPANTPGTVRVGKLAKYLPEFGWEPIVLTADKVKGLPQTLPIEVNQTHIIRTPSFSLSDFVTGHLTTDVDSPSPISTTQKDKKDAIWRAKIINAMRLMKPFYTLPLVERLLFEPMGWYRYVLKAGLELIAKKKVDIIFSSFSPSVSHLVASQLHRKTKIPWVAEFRDPWSLNEYKRKTQPFQFFEEQWDKQTMKEVNFIITVSEIWASKLQTFYSKPIIVIPNGFDEEDYAEDVSLVNKFVITYTGNIYPGKRDPTPLFEAIANLRQEGRIFHDDIEVRFFGSNVTETISPLIQKYQLQDFVKIYGFVPFKESIRKQKESTVLLLLSWDDPRDAGTLTAKIYEYIGSGRPILALAFKGGAIDNLLRQSGCGIVANEPGEIKDILAKWIEEFNQHHDITSYYHPNKEIIKSYTRKEQAKKLAEVFDCVIAQPQMHGQYRECNSYQNLH